MKWGCRGHWGNWGCWGYRGHLGSWCQGNHLIWQVQAVILTKKGKPKMVENFESSFTFGTFRLYPHESTKTFQSLLWDILRLFRWFVFVKNNNLIMIKDFLKINVSCFRNWLLDLVDKVLIVTFNHYFLLLKVA